MEKYSAMQTKSNIQLAVEAQQYREACVHSLNTLLETYNVADAIFGFNADGSLREITKGYATVIAEAETTKQAVESLHEGSAIRVVDNKLQIVNIHSNITECEEGFKTLEITEA